MRYKIVFLDIDGTILQPDHTYTDSTIHAISQLQKQGIQVFLATGRPLHEIGNLAKELKIDSFIGYNGAFATHQNKTIVDEPMNATIIRQFLQIARKNHNDILMYSSEKNYFMSLENPAVQTFIDIFQFKQNEIFKDSIINYILGATLVDVTPNQAPLYEIGTNIRLAPVNVKGVEGSYDIIRTNVNKGEAVRKLLDQLNIPKEQAIAFGDGMNDKEMLQAVGEGFAMGNAHPDLFPYAKHRTTSVEDSGIFNGLKRLGLVN